MAFLRVINFFTNVKTATYYATMCLNTRTGVVMEISIERRNEIKKALLDCQRFFIAIGNEVRQQIVLIMLSSTNKENRAVDIANEMYLSRPNISHHLQVLKNAGIVASRKEGKNIFYYLCPDDAVIVKIVDLMDTIKYCAKNL